MEIGSEFEWIQLNDRTYELDWLPKERKPVFTFSGRTAIETALRNIPYYKTVLLPAYCCDAMIEPFRAAKADILFYAVTKAEVGIRVEINDKILALADILLICNYFGFKVDYPDNLILEFKKKGGVVIEDVTHSLLSLYQNHSYSDFIVASLRKWGPLIDGGLCWRKEGKITSDLEKPSTEFISMKLRAMQDKTRYLQGKNIKKSSFLNMYEISNHILACDYSEKSMSMQSYEILHKLNFAYIRKQRIENAKTLYSGLNKLLGVKPLFNINQMDCPLFVPIIAKRNTRDSLRRLLIKNNIFCPIHWPKPNAGLNSELYEEELSLICDQRYSSYDMEEILRVIETHGELKIL